MQPLDSVAELRTLLERRGVPLNEDAAGHVRADGTHATAAWEAFKEYMQLPASEAALVDDDLCTVDPQGDGDMLLYQTSIERPLPSSERQTGGEPPEDRIHCLSLTRQFMFENADGECCGIYHFILAFESELTPELAALPRETEWDGGDIDAWTTTVERSDPFQATVARGAVGQIRIDLTDV